jgi:hypothetical protein
MKIEEIVKSKTFKAIISIIGVLIIVLIIFKLGMFVGFKKASFSCRFMEHYISNFVMSQNNSHNLMAGLNEKNSLKSHGTFGIIINILINNKGDYKLIIKEEREPEKIVLIKSNTIIEKMKENINPRDLNINDFVVVIGEGNENGQIEASLIRVLPQPPFQPFSQPPEPLEFLEKSFR